MSIRQHSATLPNLLARLWHHLSRRRRRQFVLLMGLMLISAFAEVISLGAVLPFLGVLVAPDRVFSHPIVADVAQAWGIISADQLILPLTVAFVTAVLIAGVIRIVLQWFSTRIAFATGADLGIEVYRRALYQAYRVHVSSQQQRSDQRHHNQGQRRGVLGVAAIADVGQFNYTAGGHHACLDRH